MERTIYYTADGSDPTAGSTLYIAPFTLGSLPAAVKAFAVKDGMIDSDVATAAYTESYKISESANADLKVKFGVSTAAEAFASLHYLISSPAAGDNFTNIIKLGDYIDLDSLTIVGKPQIDNDILTGHGRLLRLIVVGINSFKPSGVYAGGPANAPNHVVFQFQNIPVTRKMHDSFDDTIGYLGTDMRAYLTGDFLTGLKTAAGLDDAMLWAPTRYAANKSVNATGAQTISDTLWLPTEREMFDDRTLSIVAYETKANQAWLEYYTNDGTRIKYKSGNSADVYWLASPSAAVMVSYFCGVGIFGFNNYDDASTVGGCAPAFCVK